MSGQSIMDRMTAAKHSIAGQGLAKTVCKSTTEEVMGPKKKHLDYLLQCTNEPNVSIPQLADLLIERTQNTSWVIVFKALISMHNLMNYGNERFTQYLASNNCTVNLASFIDKTGVQGYDMSTFIRRYSKYFNEKAYSYRTMAYDFCKVKRGREDGLLRTMSSEKLLKSLPVLQRQIDALLEFDCSANELTNGVINAAFMLLFKDLIRLFACYNDGVINLLEKYFDMNKKNCKEALDIYKKFLVRMDKVSEFLRVAENVGIDKGDIPDLAKGLSSNSVSLSAPASLLDALEQHMLSLDGKKGTTVSNKPSSTVSSAISNLANNSPNIQITEEEKKKILDEENARLQQLKGSTNEPQPAVDLLGVVAPPVKESQPELAAPQVDLLGSDDVQPMQEQKAQVTATIKPAPTTTNNPFVVSEPPTNDIAAQKPSADLVNLTGNPFIESVQTMMQTQNAFGAPTWGAPAQTEPGMGGGGFADSNFANFSNVNGTTGGTTIASLDVSANMTSAILLTPSPTSTPAVSAPAPSYDPYEAFSGLVMGTPPTGGNMEGLGGAMLGPTQGRDSPAKGFGDLGQQPPSPAASGRTASPSADAFSSDVFPATDAFSTSEPSADQSGFDAFGEVLQPQNTGQPKATKQSEQTFTNTDLDSNMMTLAGNLTMNGASQVKKQQHQWQPAGEKKKTGGESWGPTQLSQGMTWSQPVQQPQMMYVPPAAGMGAQQPMMNPAMGAPGMAPMGMQPMGAPVPMGQPMYGGMRPGMAPTGMAMGQPRPPSSQPNDPFGAL